MPTAPYEGIVEELDVSFFIPCLNEATRIGATLETVRRSMEGRALTHEVLVVDDGSTDNTAAEVESYGREHPSEPIRLIRNPANLGLACSFVEASFRGRGRYFRLICGDNVEPVESMATVLDQLGAADIVIPYYPEVPGKSAFRLALSNGFTYVVNIISGKNLRYYNGNPLYRRSDVMRWAPHNFGFGYQADLLTQLLDQDRSYVEIPIEGLHREKAKALTSLRWLNWMSVAHSLLEIVLRRMRRLLFPPRPPRQL